MVLCPKSVTCPPKLLCMRYYGAISNGWRDDRGCRECVEDYQLTMRDLTGCQAPCECHCYFCVRQPPSLRDLASHTLFKLKFVISKFELTVHTTFKEYAYAVLSGMVNIDRLLPPEFPTIRLWFAFDRFVDKYHTCPNDAPWDIEWRANIRLAVPLSDLSWSGKIGSGADTAGGDCFSRRHVRLTLDLSLPTRS